MFGKSKAELSQELFDLKKTHAALKCEFEKLTAENKRLNDLVSRSSSQLAQLDQHIKRNKIYSQEMTEKTKLISSLRAENYRLEDELYELTCQWENREEYLRRFLTSNLVSLPWLAGVISDYITYDIELEAKKLEWGSNVERQKKVASIREIRADAKNRIAEGKLAVYQLNYLLALYPQLEDILEADYKELKFTGEIPDYDPVRDYLSKEEWQSKTVDERNQLALDRYIESRKKTKWQVGRDYELAVAYQLAKQGFSVDPCGSYLRLEDMGRDIIATKNGCTYIVQCKYWSSSKQIHEKHIAQLYGTTVLYALEKSLPPESVIPVLVTNIEVSQVARAAAEFLRVKLVEKYALRDFPRIKCNIGYDGISKTYIYHLPMDAQYDNVKIDSPGECYAFTVKEAVSKGFRRAYKWHGG